MAIQCEDCGKVLKSRKAYAGHMLLAHGKRVGFMAEFDAKMQSVERMASNIMRLELAMAQLANALCAIASSTDNERADRQLYEQWKSLLNERTNGYLGQLMELERGKAHYQPKAASTLNICKGRRGQAK